MAVSAKWIQQRLADLGYRPASAVSGRFGPWTRSAVLALKGWEKLGRDGDPGPLSVARLKAAKRPTPTAGSGKRLEVCLGAQVTLLVDGSKVIRVIKISSGKPGYATPTGSYAIYRKSIRDWSYPYSVWLPYGELLQRRHRVPRVAGRPYPASPEAASGSRRRTHRSSTPSRRRTRP